MRCSVEGIMYPECAKAALFPAYDSFSGDRSDSFYAEVPHKAWKLCRQELDDTMFRLKGRAFPYIFVLGPLHKGPVDFGPAMPVYCPEDGALKGSDWEIKLRIPEGIGQLVTASDDICSEEHSLEIVAPYLGLMFPETPVCHLLASGDGQEVKRIVEILRRDFPSALILLSNNRETCCAHMWKEALGQ
jgi:hypothetical protein